MGKAMSVRGITAKYTPNQPLLIEHVPERTGKAKDVKFLRELKVKDPFVIVPANIELVDSPTKLKQCATDIADTKMMTFDCETNGLSWFRNYAVALSIYTPKGVSYFIPTRMVHAYRNFEVEELQEALFDVLTSKEVSKLAHNAKFDMHFIRRSYGIDISPESVIHDTALAQWALDENADHDLEAICTRHKIAPPWKAKQDGSFEVWPLKTATAYAGRDAINTYKVYEFQMPHLDARPALKSVLYDEDMPNMRIMYAAERRGIGWDAKYFEAVAKPEIQTAMREAEKVCKAKLGILNLAAPAQLSAALYDGLGVPRLLDSKGKPIDSTNKETLNRLKADYPIVADIQNWKKFDTVNKMFITKLPNFITNGRIHANFSVVGTVTGRMSCKEPNLQQMPKSSVGPVIRRAFVPSPGCVFVTFDYSQIELRLLAHESEDPTLIDSFIRNLDIHSSVCNNVFKIPYAECADHPKRTIAKNINFGIPYGIGAAKLASFILDEVDVAQAYIDMYFGTYPGVQHYIDRCHEQAYDNGFIETMFGRKRRLPNARSLDRRLAANAERQAQNAPIQMAAGGLIKRATVVHDNLLRQNNWPFELLLQIHDELVYEVNAEWLHNNMKVLEILENAMCNIIKLRVPIKTSCERLSRWGNKVVSEDALMREQLEEAIEA